LHVEQPCTHGRQHSSDRRSNLAPSPAPNRQPRTGETGERERGREQRAGNDDRAEDASQAVGRGEAGNAVHDPLDRCGPEQDCGCGNDRSAEQREAARNPLRRLAHLKLPRLTSLALR
jgi:hypothetical protein